MFKKETVEELAELMMPSASDMEETDRTAEMLVADAKMEAEFKARAQEYLQLAVLRLQHQLAEIIAEFEVEHQQQVALVCFNRTSANVYGKYDYAMPQHKRQLESVSVSLTRKEEES